MIDSKFWLSVKRAGTSRRKILIQKDSAISSHPDGDLYQLNSPYKEWNMGIGQDYYYKRLKVKRVL